MEIRKAEVSGSTFELEREALCRRAGESEVVAVRSKA